MVACNGFHKFVSAILKKDNLHQLMFLENYFTHMTMISNSGVHCDGYKENCCIVADYK